MADDWIARGLGVAALIATGVNTWLAFRRDRREVAAQRPIVSAKFHFAGTRRVSVEIFIANTMKQPIVLTRLAIEREPRLTFMSAKRIDRLPIGYVIPEHPTEDDRRPKPDFTIAPNAAGAWTCVILVPRSIGVPLQRQVEVIAYFDLRDGSDRLYERRFKTAM